MAFLVCVHACLCVCVCMHVCVCVCLAKLRRAQTEKKMVSGRRQIHIVQESRERPSDIKLTMWGNLPEIWSGRTDCSLREERETLCRPSIYPLFPPYQPSGHNITQHVVPSPPRQLFSLALTLKYLKHYNVWWSNYHFNFFRKSNYIVIYFQKLINFIHHLVF